MSRKSIAVSIAIPVVLLVGAVPPAYADDLDPPPGPDITVGPAADPFLDDLVDMVSEGPELAPPRN